MQTQLKYRYLRHAVFAALCASTTTSVYAQESIADNIAENEEGSVEVINVTAQRRVQSIQEVPLSVTGLSANALETRQVSNVLDLQYQVPNISLAANTGTANGARIFLRGVGEDESRISADPAVGIYVDGIYIGRQVGALFDLVDLERLEVLRGPQGTLYGRNSNGGAVKLISKGPDLGENYGMAKVSVGSDARLDARLTGNFAISDSTGIRATALTRSRDGFHTLNPNGDFAEFAGTNLGKQSTKAFKVNLLHEFNQDWSMNVGVDYTDDDSDPSPGSTMAGRDGDNNIFTIEPINGTVCSANTPVNFLPIGCFTGHFAEVKTSGVTLNVLGAIGDYDVQFLSGYRTMEDDMLSRIGFVYKQQTDQDQFSQEITVSSNYAGNFNFVTGVYYFTEDAQLDTVFVFPFELGIKTDALAIFFQSDYKFSDYTLTTGLRHTTETKEVDALAVSSGATKVESRDFNNTNFTVALNRQFTKDIMGYVSYATGFKSGGWSPDCFAATACFLPVDEETVDTLEFGLRSDLMNNRLRVNATYFINNYEGLQIGSTVPGLGFTRFNVDQTDISGLELEIIYAATKNLSFDIILGTLDAEYSSLTLDQAGGLTNAGSSPACNGIASIECALALELKNAPEYKATLGITHIAELESGIIVSRLDASVEDDSWNLVANAPESALTSVGAMVNARVSFEPYSEAWKVAGWVRNLADHTYSPASTANSFQQFAAAPLTWGVDLEYRF
ncbi:ligand-gated channel [Glaciecola punicea]|uniref:TonB-dependent receptor n=1 Tax=Glaciecola punicea TaxID=56804 RepID=UPI000872729C|nr:TonB-dependent receptor [Glaciecola punicea]OFA29894.1 ligand-gated channel [Glaciecola punicea]